MKWIFLDEYGSADSGIARGIVARQATALLHQVIREKELAMLPNFGNHPLRRGQRADGGEALNT
jgi:hypothetical protein